VSEGGRFAFELGIQSQYFRRVFSRMFVAKASSCVAKAMTASSRVTALPMSIGSLASGFVRRHVGQALGQSGHSASKRTSRRRASRSPDANCRITPRCKRRPDRVRKVSTADPPFYSHAIEVANYPSVYGQEIGPEGPMSLIILRWAAESHPDARIYQNGRFRQFPMPFEFRHDYTKSLGSRRSFTRESFFSTIPLLDRPVLAQRSIDVRSRRSWRRRAKAQ
jgi:hypothetical protein